MLTFIIQLYGSSNLHHNCHIQQHCRRHPQQQRYNSSQHSLTLSPLCAHTPVGAQGEYFLSETTVRSSGRGATAPFLGDASLINYPALFLIVLVFMTSCSNAWGLPAAGHSVDLAEGSRRLAREVQTSTTPSHSTYLTASINPSSSSSFGTDIPGEQPSTHYIVSNEEGNTTADPTEEGNTTADHKKKGNTTADPTEERNTPAHPNREGNTTAHPIQERNTPAHPIEERNTPADPKPASEAELINVLISTLEKLKVLEATDSSCFRLKKIFRNNKNGYLPLPFNNTTEPPSSSLEVFFYFEEVHTDGAVDIGLNVSNSKLSGLHQNCMMETVIQLGELPVPTLEVAAENEGNGTVSDGSNMGIGRTHIVVISTCSAIIGMFFLVAAFLRIRNYIKRARLEQEMSNRPKFRSCSVALRGATQSMEQLRRDSMISKTSHQHSDATKGSNGTHTNGSSRENSSPSSPRHDPDTATLLLLPRGAEPSVPAEVEACLQLADEDTTASASRKKMMSPTSLVNNDINANTTEHRSQISSDKILDGVVSFNGGARTPTGGTATSGSSRENGQLARGHTEGNVNPSFSSGSIRYHLTGLDDEPRRPGTLNTINKPQTSPDNIPRLFAEVNSVGTESGQITSQKPGNNGNYGSKTKLQTSAVDGDTPPQTVKGQQGEDTLSQSAVRQTSVPTYLREENNPNSLGQQVRGDGSSSRICRQNVDIETGNTLNPALEISYFGLSKSDVSLSSVTNQGNEFFGQTEYQEPIEGFVVYDTVCSDAINSSECNNNLDILESRGEVTDVNKMKMDKQNPCTAQDCQLRSTVDTTCAELGGVDTQIETLPVNVSHNDRQTIRNPPANSPARDKPLACQRGIDETELTDNMFTEKPSPHTGLADQHNSDSFPTTLPPSDGSSARPHNSLVAINNQSADLIDLASNGVALASLEPHLENVVCPSAHQVGNESSTDETLFPIGESVSCKTQSVLPATSHETLGLLPSSNNYLVSSHTCEAATDLSGECALQPHNHISLKEAPLPDTDHRQKESTRSLPHLLHELDRESSQHAEDFPISDTSLSEASARCRVNNTLSPDSESSSMASSDLCHQLLPLQAHN